MAAVLTLTTAASITALVEGIVSSLLPAINQAKGAGAEAEDTNGDASFSARVDRLCSFGSLELRKGQKNKSLERLTFDTEMDALRREQAARKERYKGHDEWSTNTILCIDKETSLLVRNKELQFEKSTISEDELKNLPIDKLYKMKETETFVMSQLTALHEEMRIYSAAIHARSIGKVEEAKATVCVFGEDRAGKTRDKYTEDVSRELVLE